jgi:DNA-binding transcriptional LysR family regulator
MQFETSDQDPSSRLVVNSIQIRTFLALVQEGSVTRIAQRFGLSHSTVSAHAKAIGEEFGVPLFRRVRAGIVVTPEGLNVYQRLRPLIELLDRSLDIVAGSGAQSSHRKPPTVLLHSGFPGAPLDLAPSLAGWPGSTKFQLFPTYDEKGDSAALRAGFFSIPDDGDLVQIRDRWVLVQGGPQQGWIPQPVDPASLAGREIIVPALPESLHGALNSLAERARINLEWLGEPLHELLAGFGQERNFAILVPTSLLSPALVQHFSCAWLSETPFDPILSVWSARGYPNEAKELATVLSELLSEPAVAASMNAVIPSEVLNERLSLKHCRSFVALYEEGNVRKAADRMCIVQPAMTVRLQNIEDQLGGPLFERVRHGLEANPKADVLYGILRPLLNDLNLAIQQLRAPVSRQVRRLKVGLIPALDDESSTAVCFADGLQSWLGLHSESEVQVVEGYSPTLIQWLRTRKIDFALVDRFLHDDQLAFHCLAEDSMAVVTNSGTGLLPEGPIALADIVHLPLVLPSSRHGLRALLVEQLQGRNLALKPRMEVDSMAAALSLVKIGGYATILPTNALKASKDRRHLSVHEIRDPHIIRAICLAHRRDGPFSDAARSFVDNLRRAFAPRDLVPETGAAHWATV